MIFKNRILLLIFLGFLLNQPTSFGQELVLYKQIDETKLYLEVHKPPQFEPSKTYPAMVFYFGGGWNGGDRSHFEKQAAYFAQRGIVCFLADYRTFKKDGVQPFECMKDAKSAMRYIRSNAKQLSVDPNQIIASGGSAGGHLAAGTATISGFNHSDDDLEVSCVPNALVLFNPVIDNGPGGYGYERVGEKFKEFSPLHNLTADVPPTIIFLGTNDKLIPVVTMEYYQLVMQKLGIRSELKLYEDQAHGFFNYHNFEYYKKTVKEADLFLSSLGYLTESPKIEIE